MVGPEPSLEELARLGLDILPRVMRLVATAAVEDSDGQLGATQFRLLKRLMARPRLGSELAHELRVTPPTVSAAIDSLVRRGLVERGEAAEDRRAIPLRITPAGARCFEATQQRALAVLLQLLEQIQPAERDALALGLNAFARVMGGYGTAEAPFCQDPAGPATDAEAVPDGGRDIRRHPASSRVPRARKHSPLHLR